MFRAFAKSAHGGRLDVGLTTYLRDSRWWMDEVHAVGMLRGEAPFFDRVSPAQHKRGLVADRQSYDLFLAAITGDKLGKLKVPVQLLIFNLRLGQKGKWTRLKS